jgi:hypothetical protein
MARFALTSGSLGTADTSFTTEAMTPGANRLVLAFVANATQGNPPSGPAIPIAKGNDLAWDPVATVVGGMSGDQRLTCFRAMGSSPSNDVVTFSFGSQIQDSCGWSIFEYDNVDRSGVNGSGAIVQSNTQTGVGPIFSAPLGPFAYAMDDIAVGAVIVDLLDTPTGITPGTGFTKIGDVEALAASGKDVLLETQDKTGGVSDVVWQVLSNEAMAAIVLELRFSLEDLARRFEPILFLDPNEKFFPSDAKRYIENSALWRSLTPFDSKFDWRGNGLSFPRLPMVPAGQLSAVMGEPGDFLGKPVNLVDNADEERFLEIGGWKDKTGTAFSGVTATSNNTFSNRTAIAELYATNPALTDSRFWYHVELFDQARLSRLLSLVNAPQLVKLLDTFNNPALLCYYMLFPGHEQPLEPTCTNVEAIEMGGFAGEWSCMAILLDRDTTSSPFTPTHIGLTGLRPAAVPNAAGTLVFPPNAFDDERRSNMKVSEFSSVTFVEDVGADGLIGEHPRLFVALGTHSLYLSPGTHDVDPYPGDIRPVLCMFDTPALAPPPATDDAPSVPVALAKLFGIASVDLIAALVALVLEGVLPAPGQGLGVVGSADSGPPDQAPAAGEGKTIRPAGLFIPDAGSDVNDWTSAQGVIVGLRKYDFLVDRTTQVWWPGDDGQTGFRGRWGQRVENDPVPRRAGMRFPEFHKMFFLALADGKASGQL